MFNRNEARVASVCALALIAWAAIAPEAVQATASPIDPQGAPAPARPMPGYQMRCWQHGRLMFEESPVALPAGSAAMRPVALDRQGRPIYLIESGAATCQLRHRIERPEPRPEP